MQLGRREWRLLEEAREALASSLDIREVLECAAPVLLRLVPAEYAALGITKPASTEFEWIVARMPAPFFAAYPLLAEHDFVLRSVAAAPNRVLRDSEMISRRDLEKNQLYGHARDLGMPLEHVMSAMLHEDEQWRSGVSLYRSERKPFSERDRAILQALAPDLRRTVRNCQRFADVNQKAQGLEGLLAQEGRATILLSPQGTEIGRTPAAAALLERAYPLNARRDRRLPEELLSGRAMAGVRVRVHRVPTASGTCTALVLEGEEPASPLPDAWASRLTPREREVTAGLLAGWDNRLIASELGCATDTVKKHVTHILDKLGADTRQQLLARARAGAG